MIQTVHKFSETLGAPKNFPEDRSIQQILDDIKRREAFEFDLMELAGRVTKPCTPEEELFYEVCYEDIYEQMYGDMAGVGKLWLPYGDFAARLNDKETKEEYSKALERALNVFKNGETEFQDAKEALYTLGMFWSMRGAL